MPSPCSISPPSTPWPRVTRSWREPPAKLLQITGHAGNVLRYELGNPLTASRVTRHAPAGTLYTPPRIVLYEDDLGRGVFEDDRPSTLFGQCNDDLVAAAGVELDQELERVLPDAAG